MNCRNQPPKLMLHQKIDLSQHFRLKEDLNVVDTYITESEISYEPIND